MPRLEQKYKSYIIRQVGDGRFQIVDPYGYATNKFLLSVEQAQQYIDKHGQPVQDLVPLVFKRHKSWKYANPAMGVLREVQVGDQCVHYLTNRMVYEDLLWDGESGVEGEEMELPEDPCLDAWRVSVFEREQMPYGDRLGWLEVEILDRCVANKSQARKFAKKYCQATGVALARCLPPNVIFSDELFDDDDEDLEDESEQGDYEYF